MIQKDKIAICIAGWHYADKDLYRQLCNLDGVKVFVISHKPSCAVPAWLVDYAKGSQIFYEENLGYDWGCYQQFLSKGFWLDFDCIFFIHDDVIIKDIGFISAVTELLEKGHSVVGNGRVSSKSMWPFIAPQSYAHSLWKPPSVCFEHDVVRGSFFCATREALKCIERLEVFWDTFHLTSGFGNWSTRSTCAKWEYLIGPRCFGFLSDNYCDSDYILELVRGKEITNTAIIKPSIRMYLLLFITTIARYYMLSYWRLSLTNSRSIILRSIKFILRFFSGASS